MLQKRIRWIVPQPTLGADSLEVTAAPLITTQRLATADTYRLNASLFEPLQLLKNAHPVECLLRLLVLPPDITTIQVSHGLAVGLLHSGNVTLSLCLPLRSGAILRLLSECNDAFRITEDTDRVLNHRFDRLVG